MSIVKIKNGIVKAIQAAKIEGLRIEAKLEQGRIKVSVLSAPFDAYKPGVITLTDHGHSVSFSLTEEIRTPEAQALEARLKEIAAGVIQAAGAKGGVSVYFNTEREQAQRMRAATQAAAQATVAA